MTKMKTPLEPTTLQEVLRAFLRAEFDSPTEQDRVIEAMSRLKVGPRSFLEDSAYDLWPLFQAYRGGESLFRGLDLTELRWFHSSLTAADLRSRIWTCRNHFEERYGSRSLQTVAAVWDRRGVSNGVMTRIRNGEVLEPPILIADESLEKLVILEGHNRLVSYLREVDAAPLPIAVLIGVGTDAGAWGQW